MIRKDGENVRPDHTITTTAASGGQRTGKYFWRHVCHTAGYTSMQSAFRVVNRHIKVGEVNVSVSVQENVIRLDITARRNQSFVSIHDDNSFGYSSGTYR